LQVPLRFRGIPMFETVEVGNILDPETYHRDLPALRGNLLAAQNELAKANFSVVVVFSGVEGAGKTEMANHLLEWMDPHGIRVHALGDPTDEERERPPMWRFWRLLPPWRRLSVFLTSWYGDPLDNAFRGRIDETAFDQTLSEIADFERMLFHEGVLLIKFWLHLSHEAQKKRFKELRSDKLQRWRVTKHDLKLCKRYDQFRAIAERMLQATETVEAPWTLVESADAHFRNCQVGSHLLERLRERLGQAKPAAPTDEADTVIIAPRPALIFNKLDM